MTRLLASSLICGLLCVGCLSVHAQNASDEPRREVLGLSLGMSKETARRRLQELGQLEREERKRQEVWKLRDPRFAHLLLGFDSQDKLRYVTALARAGGSRVRYREMGDLKRARNDGAGNNYYYTWELAAHADQPRGLAIARGTDPEYLSSYSLKKVE